MDTQHAMLGLGIVFVLILVLGLNWWHYRDEKRRRQIDRENRQLMESVKTHEARR